MIALAMVAGLLGTYEAGAAAGIGGVAGDLALLATPWAGARWGTFAVALQAPLRFIPDEGGLRSRDWDQTADAGRVLRFVRFGDEGGGLRAGRMAGLTLGQGTLVRRYHNGTDDDRYRTGVEAYGRGGGVELRGFADQALGPPVFGGRLVTGAVGPLRVGFTGAADAAAPRLSTVIVESASDTGSGARTDGYDNGLEVGYGADISAAIAVEPFVVTPYVELNRLGGSDPGLHAGLMVDRAGVEWRIGLRGEFIRAGDDYDWARFDTLYLVERWGFDADTPTALGGRGSLQLTYAGAATFGVEYADAQGPRRGDLSGWLEIPTDAVSLTASYARRHADGRDLFEPGDSVAAIALRTRLSKAWSLGTTLARAWRRDAGNDSPPQPHTEAALTVEAIVPP